MARRFVDARGTEWEVWEVGGRKALADAAPRTARKGGRSWLRFDSATQRRRLDRYPAAWQALGVRELAELCELARPEPPLSAARGTIAYDVVDVP